MHQIPFRGFGAKCAHNVATGAWADGRGGPAGDISCPGNNGSNVAHPLATIITVIPRYLFRCYNKKFQSIDFRPIRRCTRRLPGRGHRLHLWYSPPILAATASGGADNPPAAVPGPAMPFTKVLPPLERYRARRAGAAVTLDGSSAPDAPGDRTPPPRRGRDGSPPRAASFPWRGPPSRSPPRGRIRS